MTFGVAWCSFSALSAKPLEAAGVLPHASGWTSAKNPGQRCLGHPPRSPVNQHHEHELEWQHDVNVERTVTLQPASSRWPRLPERASLAG
jgi:hypothetical protein